MTPRGLRKRYLLLFVSPDREATRRKLSQLLDLTGFGDWLVLLLIARNTDRVVFGEVVDYLRFPDYDWDLEPLDPENRRLVEGRARAAKKVKRSKRRRDRSRTDSSSIGVSRGGRRLDSDDSVEREKSSARRLAASKGLDNPDRG